VVAYLDWPGLAQVARLTRTRRIATKESTEVVYLVTSLSVAEASPARLLDLARAHWAIENKLHYVRDVTFNEDRCRVRKGARPLAALRNLALAIIRARGLHVPAARENFREDRAAAILAVTGTVL
jgi:predicted transposase YbfD/YdcC